MKSTNMDFLAHLNPYLSFKKINKKNNLKSSPCSQNEFVMELTSFLIGRKQSPKNDVKIHFFRSHFYRFRVKQTH